VYFFEFELGVGFVGGNQCHGADAEDAIEEGPSQLYVDDAEHVDVVDSSVEYSPAVLDTVGGDFVSHHFEPEHFCKED